MAETEAGTVGNGRGGASFLIFRRLAAGLAGGGLGLGTSCSSATSSPSTASGVLGVLNFARFALCSPWGWSSGLFRLVVIGVTDQSQGELECRKRQGGFKLFPSISSLSLHHQILYAAVAYSTLSHRRHESAARYRRTKHSDVEGQEADQKPRCCQRVLSIVAAVSSSMTL